MTTFLWMSIPAMVKDIRFLSGEEAAERTLVVGYAPLRAPALPFQEGQVTFIDS
jgi:hypothetical protein